MERVEKSDNLHRIVTRMNGDARGEFVLPSGIDVERVVYVNSDIPAGLLCFEAPVSKSWLKMYSMDGPPETEREVKWMLRAGYATFHRPVWHILDNKLYLYPSAPCDGKLVVDYEHQSGTTS